MPIVTYSQLLHTDIEGSEGGDSLSQMRMSSRWRRLPEVVEARRLVAADLELQEELAEWCGGKLCGTRLPVEQRVIRIPTLEGMIKASLGDWIVRGVAGEFYPVKPDIFARIYEPAGLED